MANYVHPEIERVYPNKDSIHPEIIFNLKINYAESDFLPVELTGEVLSEDNKKIGRLEEYFLNQNTTRHYFPNDNDNKVESHHYYYLNTILSEKALEYIEDIRHKNSKKDVILKLKLNFKAISTNINLLKPPAQPHAEYYNVLSNNTQLMEVVTIQSSISFTISTSDWAQVYLPVFGKGTFLVLEIPNPIITKGSSFIEEKMNDAINAIPKMEKELLSGEWNEVIEKSRPILELLNERTSNETPSELHSYLLNSGFSQDATKHLLGSISELFKFASKFIHKIGKAEKTLNPDIIASKEDAYLIFSVCTNFINLITTKINKLNR